jgi:multiple sugar transport system permease protein
VRGRGARRLAEGLRLLAIACAVVVAILPLAWVVLASLKSAADVSQMPPRLVFTPTLDNYRSVLDAGFAAFFRNSVVVTLAAVALSVALGVPAAYGFSRLRVPALRALLLFVLSVRFVPYIVFAVPLFVIMVRLQIVGTHLGLVVVYILINLPLVVWMMKSFFDDVPTDIDDAAAVDGATRLQSFAFVVLPSTAAGVACVTILSFIFTWNEYLLALVLSGRNAQTLPVVLTRFLGGMEDPVRWGLLSASSVVVLAPVVVVTLLVHRYVRVGFGGTTT